MDRSRLHGRDGKVSKDSIGAVLDKNIVNAPMPFQAFVWPVLLRSFDMIAVGSGAQCGKKLAYLLPAMLHCNNRYGVAGGPIAVILSHEFDRIATIEREFKEFQFGSVGDAVYLHTGSADDEFRKAMNRISWQNQKLLIAHPQALYRCAELGCIKLDQVTFVVIDRGECCDATSN